MERLAESSGKDLRPQGSQEPAVLLNCSRVKMGILNAPSQQRAAERCLVLSVEGAVLLVMLSALGFTKDEDASIFPPILLTLLPFSYSPSHSL